MSVGRDHYRALYVGHWWLSWYIWYSEKDLGGWSPLCCTKYNNPSVFDQCTNFIFSSYHLIAQMCEAIKQVFSDEILTKYCLLFIEVRKLISTELQRVRILLYIGLCCWRVRVSAFVKRRISSPVSIQTQSLALRLNGNRASHCSCCCCCYADDFHFVC